MDVKIETMDTMVDNCSNLCYISGIDELVQRVKIACTVSKGSFVFDRELGRAGNLPEYDDPELQDKLEMIFKEATVDIPYSNLVVTQVSTDKALTATVEITCGDSCATTEVTING